MVEAPKKKNKHVLVGVGIVLVILLGFGVWMMFRTASLDEHWESVLITPENLPTYLSVLNAVQDLPQEGVIALVVGEHEYTITRGSVSEGAAENPDMRIWLPEEYLATIGAQGWCGGLQAARAANAIGIDIYESETSLAFKYHALLKYRQCLGL